MSFSIFSVRVPLPRLLPCGSSAQLTPMVPSLWIVPKARLAHWTVGWPVCRQFQKRMEFLAESVVWRR